MYNNDGNIPNNLPTQSIMQMTNNQQYEDPNYGNPSSSSQYEPNIQMATNPMMMQNNENIPFIPQFDPQNYPQNYNQQPYFPPGNMQYSYGMNGQMDMSYAQQYQQFQQYQQANWNYCIKIGLKNEKQWKTLNAEVNEMMVLNNGREIFPKLEYSIQGLIPHMKYTAGVKLRLLHPHPFRYTRNEPNGWIPSKDSCLEIANETKEVFMASCKDGYDFGRNGITFNNAKIYNIGMEKKKKAAKKNSEDVDEKENEGVGKSQKGVKSKKGEEIKMMEVKSHYMYIPVMTIYEVRPDNSFHKIKSIEFPETSFVAVTSYKNEKVKNLKIKMNPFVRGDVRRNAAEKQRMQTPSSNSSTSFNSTTSPSASLTSSSFGSTFTSPSTSASFNLTSSDMSTSSDPSTSTSIGPTSSDTSGYNSSNYSFY